MTTGANWGKIAAISLLLMTAVAVVLLVTTDLVWVVLLILAIGLIDAWFLWRVMPRVTGANQLDQMNAEAEAKILDGDWGVPPDEERP